MTAIETIPRQGLHRATFVAAGIYNLAFGAYSALDPQWTYRLARMEPLNHPEIFAAMAMIVGLYGVAYLEVARRPARGWVIAAVGFVGKILGPIGALSLILQGKWPLAAAAMCLTNDLIWWVPFGLYLRDAWPAYRRDWARV